MTTSPFQTLQSTLHREGFPSSEWLTRHIPYQYYCAGIKGFSEKLLAFLKERNLTEKTLHICVDGVDKRVSGTTYSLDECALQALESEKLKVRLLNVTELAETDELHASAQFLPPLRKFIREHAGDVFVVLGSGTVTDLIKHALFQENSVSAFLCVPTALTVTAFTSSFAVIDEGGAKRTRPSRQIDATFWVGDVLRSAPIAMSRAGYGDLLARFVAYTDWYLSFQIGIATRYDEVAFRLMEPFSDEIKNACYGFSQSELSETTTESLSAALAMAGIAMSVSGETTPLSGFEHTISHALDYLRLTSERPLVLHGEQVGLACLTSAAIVDWLVAQEQADVLCNNLFTAESKRVENMVRNLLKQAPYFPEGSCPTVAEDALKEKVDLAAEVFVKDYLKKHEQWQSVRHSVRDTLEKKWSEIRNNLKRLSISGKEMENLLKAAGLPLIPEDTMPSTTALEYRWAIRFSPFVRARMSLADFVFWLGEDPALIAAV